MSSRIGCKLDLSDSSDVAERLGQAHEEFPWHFNDLVVASGCLKSLVVPQLAPDKRERV